ncbi:MAG TPA: hypothetical protein VG366_00865 [Solirubrobacteraceae bacterium]|nr:hypothetical protein [Solirubrobacteraceae bacterium]
MHRPRHRLALATIVAAIAIGMAGCGATAEPGAETFYTQHGGEARRASRAVALVAAHLGTVTTRPSHANLGALAVAASIARRTLLAAADWAVNENSEEEDVSQAELEINEAAGAMLKAMTAIHQYAGTESRAALVLYRHDLNGGSERWNQGMAELWHLVRRSHPPTIQPLSDR